MIAMKTLSSTNNLAWHMAGIKPGNKGRLRSHALADFDLQDESVDADPERRCQLKRSVLVHGEVKVSEQHLHHCAHMRS